MVVKINFQKRKKPKPKHQTYKYGIFFKGHGYINLVSKKNNGKLFKKKKPIHKTIRSVFF